MAKMVSLRLTKKEAEEEYGSPTEPVLPEYPYGTRLNFDSEQTEDLDLEDCEAEEEIEIEARGHIRSVEITDREGEEPRRCVSIQLTEISIDRDAKKKARKENERVGRLASPTRE